MTKEHAFAEWISISVISTFFGLIFFIFGLINLLGDRILGSWGMVFFEEMDGVMGGLLSLPRYSKMEGTVLIFGSIFVFLNWW